jgi:hypothetical protein
VGHLPPGFADDLARLLEHGHDEDVAEIIEAATQLDDERLGVFLTLFAERVRSSSRPLRREELAGFLRRSALGGGPTSVS